MYNLAVLYVAGQGVARDVKALAAVWEQRAVDHPIKEKASIEQDLPIVTRYAGLLL